MGEGVDNNTFYNSVLIVEKLHCLYLHFCVSSLLSHRPILRKVHGVRQEYVCTIYLLLTQL